MALSLSLSSPIPTPSLTIDIDIVHFKCLEEFEIGTDGYPIPGVERGDLSQEIEVM